MTKPLGTSPSKCRSKTGGKIVCLVANAISGAMVGASVNDEHYIHSLGGSSMSILYWIDNVLSKRRDACVDVQEFAQLRVFVYELYRAIELACDDRSCVQDSDCSASATGSRGDGQCLVTNDDWMAPRYVPRCYEGVTAERDWNQFARPTWPLETQTFTDPKIPKTPPCKAPCHKNPFDGVCTCPDHDRDHCKPGCRLERVRGLMRCVCNASAPTKVSRGPLGYTYGVLKFVCTW